MILGIYQTLENWSEQLRKYVIDNNNPVTMLILFLGLLGIFIIAYGYFHKGE